MVLLVLLVRRIRRVRRVAKVAAGTMPCLVVSTESTVLTVCCVLLWCSLWRGVVVWCCASKLHQWWPVYHVYCILPYAFGWTVCRAVPPLLYISDLTLLHPSSSSSLNC